MNKTQQLIRERKRKFKEQFITPRGLLNCYATNNTNLVLDFNDETISLLLNSIKEDIEQMKDFSEDIYCGIKIENEKRESYNSALSDISTLLSETISNIQTK